MGRSFDVQGVSRTYRVDVRPSAGESDRHASASAMRTLLFLAASERDGATFAVLLEVWRELIGVASLSAPTADTLAGQLLHWVDAGLLKVGPAVKDSPPPPPPPPPPP